MLAGASSELEFYRHRLHLERESVRRAKQALAEQKMGLESRQIQLRHKQANSSLQQLQQVSCSVVFICTEWQCTLYPSVSFLV